MLEFALAIPFVLLMMLLVSDMIALGRGNLRTQNAAERVGQIISQCERIGADDEARLLALTKRVLGNTANEGRYRLIINAFGRDNTDNDSDPTNAVPRNIGWKIDVQGGTPRPGEPALSVSSDGDTMPAGPEAFEMKQNVVLFRTEVFMSLDRTPLTRMSNVLQTRVMVGSKELSSKVTLGFETAKGEALHVTRTPNTDTLRTKTSSTGCLQ